MALLRDCAHLYSTNAVPNPQEAKALQREIDSLKSKIANLKSQLQEVEEELHQYEVVFSPIRRLPVGVLGEIFSLALPTTLEDKDREQLLDFCLVCKLWRDAALSARWVWGSVAIDINQLSYAFEEIVSWLNRSGDFPKSLEVSFGDYNEDIPCFDCGDLGAECKLENAILAKLLTDGPVLDHLCLRYGGSKCFWNLVDTLQIYNAIAKPKTRPWDHLRSLALGFSCSWGESEGEAHSTFHHIPSSITSLSFISPSFWAGIDGTPDSPLHIPPHVLQRLTCLTLTSDCVEDHGLRLLKHCQNVETLTLDILGENPLGNPNDLTPSQLAESMVHLPQLRTLRLRRLLPAVVNLLLFLDTPNLVSLDIQLKDSKPETQSFARTILSFVERSKCQNTFRHLSIRDCTVIDEKLSTLLRGLSFITHLALHNVSINEDGDIFQKLCFPTLALPHLQVFKLLESPPQICFGDLEEFLRAHRPWRYCGNGFVFGRPPNNLKKVIVTYKETRARLTSDDNSYICALRRSGMFISVGPLKY